MTAIIHCELRARSGQGPAVLAVLDRLIADTADEPGAMLYAVHVDAADSERLCVYEWYRDAAACSVHMEGPGVRRALAAFGPLLAEPPRITSLAWHGGFMREGLARSPGVDA